jgi:hypothetical protein
MRSKIRTLARSRASRLLAHDLVSLGDKAFGLKDYLDGE